MVSAKALHTAMYRPRGGKDRRPAYGLQKTRVRYGPTGPSPPRVFRKKLPSRDAVGEACPDYAPPEGFLQDGGDHWARSFP